MFKIRDTDFDTLVDKSLEICNYAPQNMDGCKSVVLDNFGLIYKYNKNKINLTFIFCTLKNTKSSMSNANPSKAQKLLSQFWS